MAGHGSSPPDDRGNHPKRKVGREPVEGWHAGSIDRIEQLKRMGAQDRPSKGSMKRLLGLED